MHGPLHTGEQFPNAPSSWSSSHQPTLLVMEVILQLKHLTESGWNQFPSILDLCQGNPAKLAS